MLHCAQWSVLFACLIDDGSLFLRQNNEPAAARAGVLQSRLLRKEVPFLFKGIEFLKANLYMFVYI